MLLVIFCTPDEFERHTPSESIALLGRSEGDLLVKDETGTKVLSEFADAPGKIVMLTCYPYNLAPGSYGINYADAMKGFFD